MLDNQLYKSVKLDDHLYHSLRAKSDSEILHYEPLTSKFQASNKFP